MTCSVCLIEKEEIKEMLYEGTTNSADGNINHWWKCKCCGHIKSEKEIIQGKLSYFETE